ncbi:lytic murein transglycosylase [Qipengyuania atrilutea]|uniref:Lytic murein transglycosylase n=1 Tax=Qipengyuania atrilutea TaxID=2744473 RepID=A0A850H9R9_9SPHN|nr:lytic murein transglycosylase [Actirhodobacter atriluteus]NVD43819.1 lytic murein transglycosylase [Actirhodobacter atriluteus]
MPKFLKSFLAVLLVTAPVGASAQDLSFDAYLQVLKAQARAEGVSEQTIALMTDGLAPSQRVIELDQAQPGSPSRPGVFPSVQNYIDRHVDSARISGGRDVYRSSQPIIRRIEAEYGVPGQILTAIWGHETAYGNVTGGFDLAQALATLAWEGRRRELFANEFVSLLKIADRGFPKSQLQGSWAGAFGNPQFLPSVYLRLAKDGDGDGRADLYNSKADTLASIANYFRDAGWRTGQPWGVRAAVPAGLDIDSMASEIAAPVCPRVHQRHSEFKTVAEWRALGVRPLQPIGEDVMAFLFQPDGAGTPAYLLTGNYRVILEYNCSNYYAMSVGLLADAIAP